MKFSKFLERITRRKENLVINVCSLCPAFVPCPAGRKRREAANLFSLNADYGPQVAQMTSKFAQGQFGNGPANLAAPIVPPAPARPAYPQAAAPTRATYAPSAVASARARAAYAPAPARAAYVPAAAAPARAAYAPAAAPLQAPAPVSNSYKLNTPIGPNTHGQQITFAPSQAAPARAAPARPYVQPARARPAPARATYVQAQAPARANYAIASTAARAAQQRPAYVPAPAPQRAAPRRVTAQAPRRAPAQAPRRAPAQAPRRAPQQPRAPPRFANYKPAPTPSRAPAPVREQGAYPETEPEPVTRKPVGQRYPEAEPYLHDPSGDDGEPYVHQTWGKKAYLARKQQELEAQRLEAEAAQQVPLEYENEIEQPRGGQNYADYY